MNFPNKYVYTSDSTILCKNFSLFGSHKVTWFSCSKLWLQLADFFVEDLLEIIFWHKRPGSIEISILYHKYDYFLKNIKCLRWISLDFVYFWFRIKINVSSCTNHVFYEYIQMYTTSIFILRNVFVCECRFYLDIWIGL